jgi:hypothetical protein
MEELLTVTAPFSGHKCRILCLDQDSTAPLDLLSYNMIGLVPSVWGGEIPSSNTAVRRSEYMKSLIDLLSR